MRIVLIDYNAGNISSVQNALSRLGKSVVLSSDPDEIRKADKVILPGVGHARHAMKQLSNKNLISVLKELKQPFLGVCLGMQLLFEISEEEQTQTLGILSEKVYSFTKPKKIPHMGWNAVNFSSESLFSELNHSYFYFVHSYFAPKGAYSEGLCNYYGDFSAVVKKDNYYGCQFHPEKSADAGLEFLEIFLNKA